MSWSDTDSGSVELPRRTCPDPVLAYNRIAPDYDRQHARWKKLFGSQAVGYLEHLVREYVPPGGSILDAGTGTGDAIRMLLKSAAPHQVVGVDIAHGMLAQAQHKFADSQVHLCRSDVMRLPFPDASFDLVTATWVLEVLTDPVAGVVELQRVLKPEGRVVYLACTVPASWTAGLAARLVSLWFRWNGTGRFLAPAEQPLPHGPRAHLHRFRQGCVTVAALGKCCTVSSTHQNHRALAYDASILVSGGVVSD